MPDINPELGVLNTFRTQSTEIQFAIGEYIDNSIDSHFKYEKLLNKNESDFKPYIDITFDQEKNTIAIEDNCAGIHKEDEERAFKIGITNPNDTDIGTYGMGMKVSSFWFTPTWEIETKPINEPYKKTFKVDLEKIMITGKTEDSKVSSDADPFTRVTLRDVYPGRLPKDTRKLKSIQKYLFEMYRFMILERSITIRFNGKPLDQDFPKIFKKRYIDDRYGEDKLWLAELPAFDLGTINRNGKSIELKTLGGGVYIKQRGSNKDQKGFSMFWKKRLVDGHPQRPWMPGTDTHDIDAKLAIYGATNQYAATRLEGYIHLCPDFNVPSTKDGVVWEGVEEILIEKLKEFLENATLSNDESGKKYNFIKQCKKIGELNAQDEEDDSPEDDSPADDSPIEDIIDDIGGDGEGEIFIAPIDGDDDEIEEEFFDDDSIQTVSLKYENTTWNIKIKTVLKDDEKFYRIIDGPHGSKDDFSRDLGLKINLGHPFFRFHFFQGNQQKEGTIKICIALALAEAISAELTGNQAASVRLRFNEILNTFGESY